MDNQINQVIDKVAEKFGIMIDWSQQNVMPYIQDLIQRMCKYEITTSIVWIFLSIIIVIPFIVWWKNIYTNSRITDNYGVLSCEAMLLVIFSIFTFVISVFIICVQINDIALAMYLPEKLFMNVLNNI